MSFENIGWSDLEILRNITECLKLLKQGLESLNKNKFEDALSFLSDASTLMYISLDRTITRNIAYKHLWSLIVQFNLLVISVTLSFLVRAKQNGEESKESLGGATALIALITAFLNPMIKSIIEQETKSGGYTLAEKDRYLLGDIMRLNEIVREFKKQFEEDKKVSTETKPKKATRKRKKTQAKQK
ncbi:MAG: hypothetical protein ACETWM_18435 [Candidatus Lokiarchaeia archaeon]